MLMLLVVTALSVAPRGFEREEALGRFLRTPCAQQDVWRSMWEGMKERSVCQVLQSPPLAPTTFAEAEKIMESAWSIPHDAAVALLEVELMSRTRDISDRNLPEAWVNERFESAIRAAPGSPAVVHAIAAALGDGAHLAVLESALKTFEHPAPVARTLLRGTYSSVGELAAVIALADDPNSLEAIVAAAAENHGYRSPFTDQVLQYALESKIQPASTAKLAHAVLDDALHDNNPEWALEIWASMPQRLQRSTLKIATTHAFGPSSPSLANLLSLATLETGGDLAQSIAIAPHVQEPTWPSLDRVSPFDHACSDAVVAELLLRARDAKRAAKDAFALASAMTLCYAGPAFPRLTAEALNMTQPLVARSMVRRALTPPESGSFERGDASSALVESFEAQATKRISLAKDRHRVATETLRKTLAVEKPMPTVASHQLLSPPLSVWVEKPLPAGMHAAPDDRSYREPPKDLTLPRGYWPARIERSGDEMWVVGASQNIDPAGEASPGGYWLLHSKTGGKDWLPPIYTGLRVQQPYVVAANSELKLVSQGRVALEVRVRELDTESVSFPPVSLKAKREASGLFLETTLAALTKDSDADGLSDLIEDRLLTNPLVADSDGDGFNDGEDSLPTVPMPTREPGGMADLLTDVVKSVLGPGAGLQANVVGTGTSMLEQVGGRPAPISSDRAAFIIGDVAGFVGVRSSHRIIVLTEDEAAAASKSRGLLYGLQLDVVLDASQANAVIRWSERWRGGAYKATKDENGHWALVEISSWIT